MSNKPAVVDIVCPDVSEHPLYTAIVDGPIHASTEYDYRCIELSAFALRNLAHWATALPNEPDLDGDS